MMTADELCAFRLMLGLDYKKAGELMYLSKTKILNVEMGKTKDKSIMYLMELAYTKYYEDLRKEELIELVRDYSERLQKMYESKGKES